MTIRSATATKVMWFAIGFGTLFGMTGLTFLILMTSLQEKVSQGVFVLGYTLMIVYGLLFLICLCLAVYADWQNTRTEVISG